MPVNPNIPKSLLGGRGNKAPYETTHIRVPLPLKEIIQELVDNYKSTNHVPDNINQLIQPESSDDRMIAVDDAISLAHAILKQKKSAKLSLQKLLTAIYNVDVVL